MGCFCPRFREEPVTRPCVGWAGLSLSTFLDGFPTPPELPPSQKPSGGVLIGEHRPVWNVRLYAGVTTPRATYQSKGR